VNVYSRSFLLCLTFLLNACSLEQSANQIYLNRLANVLNEETAKLENNIEISALPSTRKLKKQVTANSLSIREFLSLRQCKLHIVIAHRNSLIGKVAKDSQLLINDLEILETGPACLEKIEDLALTNKLAVFLKSKKQSISTSLWNAIIADDEYQKFWRIRRTTGDYPRQLPTETVTNLTALASLSQITLEHQFSKSIKPAEDLETHLDNLRFGDGGELLFEYLQLQKTMQLANQLVKDAIKKPLCLLKKPNERARYLQNVVNKFFINGVQSHSVLLDRRKAQLMPHVESLERKFDPIAPKSFTAWQSRRSQLLASSNMLTQHAQLLQTLYAQCGLQAGTAS